MIKQIRTDQLKPGMYIHDLNCGWLDHPFVSNTFQVRDQATVGKIIDLGIREVYIDTLKGADVWVERAQRERGQCRHRTGACRRLPNKACRQAGGRRPQERSRARPAACTARPTKLVRLVLDDIRFGQKIQVDSIEPAGRQHGRVGLPQSGCLAAAGPPEESRRLHLRAFRWRLCVAYRLRAQS